MPDLIATLCDLVAINSVNPAYGGPGELALVEYLEAFFAKLGIETSRQEVFAGRPNLLARLPGRDRSRCIVLEAHTDTVTIEGMSIDPLKPEIRGNRLYGRGSCDTKAGLATMMHTLVHFRQGGNPPPCDLLLAAAVDEEFSYRGVVRLCEGLRADAAIVAEPTELRAVCATKGVLRFAIVVRGRAAHSSKPHLGVNAIVHMAQVIAALQQHALELAASPHPLVGPATCSIGVIQGGLQVNQVPDFCRIEIDRRLLPGQSASSALEEYRRLLAALPGVEASMEEPLLLVDEALDTAPQHPLISAAGKVLGAMGLNPAPCGVPFGCDASKLARAGVPSMVFGPGSIDRAHTADEYVEINEVEQALQFLIGLVQEFPNS